MQRLRRLKSDDQKQNAPLSYPDSAPVHSLQPTKMQSLEPRNAARQVFRQPLLVAVHTRATPHQERLP
jgi:hypothetical protein